MLSMRISSYGCKFGEHERSVRVPRGTALSNSSFLSFFYNMATTTWALKHVLFLTDYNYFSRCTVKENKLSLHYCNTTQSVKQQLNENA